MTAITTRTPEETRAFAARLGARLRPSNVVLLQGGLGAGKTTFAQGLAEGMGIRAPVTSPTFTLVHEYPGPRGPLFHFDLYRLAGPEEIADLGFDEYLEHGGVIVVEWAEQLGPLAPPDCLLVRIEIGEDDRRQITLAASGPRSAELVRECREC